MTPLRRNTTLPKLSALQSAASSFWQQLLVMLEQALLTDAGPDVLAFLQWYEQNGLEAMFTPVGQAEIVKVLAALQADAITAGSDVTKQIAGLLASWLQGYISAQTSGTH